MSNTESYTALLIAEHFLIVYINNKTDYQYKRKFHIVFSTGTGYSDKVPFKIFA